MILDIIIGLVLLAMAIYGFKKGFIYSLIHTVGWVGALALAYFSVPYVETFLRDNTGAYKALYKFLANHFDSSLSLLDTTMKSSPKAITQSLTSYSTNIVDGVTSSFANVIFAIFVFMGLFVILKIILWLILRFLSKDYNGGFTNFFDGFFGIIFGLVKGAILILLLLTLLMPAVSMAPADFLPIISKQLETSVIAQEVYNNNFLLIILQAFFKPA